ncbi:hypothetical protein Tco_1502909 [Tanacetum coccineum]
MERELGAGYSFERKTCFVYGSLSHLIKDCDYYERKMAREAALKNQRVVHADVRQATPAWTNTNRHMEHRGIFDSGCSRHMTGNRAHLEDYKELSKVGSVTFGGSKGSISGKGTIRLGNLVFDDVAFVKELGHFNLFSISQICDKKLNVLFTEKECFVVSSDFKMPDENQVLLKVPRQHNMYTFDMKNVDSSKGYTCLLAKASSDEAKLWHKRRAGCSSLCKHLGPVRATAPTSTNHVNTGSDNLNTGFEEVTPGNIEAISPSADHEEEVFSDADDDEMPE